jgi:hypothetical protein
MKRFLAHLKNSSIIKLTFFSFSTCYIFTTISCKGQVAPLKISPKAVYTEYDSFKTSNGNIIFKREDYFLITGINSNKSALKHFLDSTSAIIKSKNSLGFGIYFVSYYVEDSTLNKKLIDNAYQNGLWKVFARHNKDNLVASYNYTDTILSYIDWGDNFYYLK